MPARTPNGGFPRPLLAVSVAVGVVVLAWSALWLASAAVRETRTTTATFDGGRVLRLVLDASSGDVAIAAERRDDVEVVARRRATLVEPRLVQRVEDGALRLASSCGFWGWPGPESCGVDFELRVPRGLPMEVEASSGSVRLSGAAGRVRLRAGSGSLRVERSTGPLDVAASSGDVDVAGYRGRDVRARASSGDVAIAAAAAPQRVVAEASSGDVTVAVPGRVPYAVEAEASAGEVQVDVDQERAAPRSITARASSGDVRVVRLGDTP